MSTYILSFESADATLELAGGKGANLGELRRTGFPVPPGFLISTDAYRTFVQANQLGERLLALANAVVPDDPLSLERASAQIRDLFAQGTTPEDVAAAVDFAYQDLKSPAVAVRSSATAEDLPGLSFAGQQETILNVMGAAAVRTAVQACWASLWTARALGYRARNRIAPKEVALAVVVQQMVSADVSGVMFTANPLTGRRDEVVIDASFGLGEAIVSGQVEPDHYIVDARTMRITSRKVGAKALAIVSRADGGTENVAPKNATSQALSDAQIEMLAFIGSRIAAHYGAPQDVEWAWANEQFYILQARPVTSLYPLPDLPNVPDDERIYFSLNVVQGVLDPFTPLGISAFRSMARGLPFQREPRQFAPDAGGRLFLDITDVARDPRLRHVLFAFLSRGDPASRPTLLHLIETGHVPERRIFHPLTALRLPWRMRTVIARLLQAVRNPAKAVARAVARAERYLEQVERHAREPRSLDALIESFETDLRGFAPNVLAHMIAIVAPAVGAMSVVDNLLVKWLGLPRNSALRLMRSVPHNVTTEMDLKLWALALAIHADPHAREVLLHQPVEDVASAYRARTLPDVAQQALDAFLQQYGMRAVTEIDMGRPRWREDPSSILQTLSSYVQLAELRANGQAAPPAPDEQFRRGATEAEQLADEYVARVRRTHFGAVRAKVLRALITHMRVLGGYRETPKLFIIKTLDAYRSAWLAQGAALTTRGLLLKPEDIFFAPLGDLKRFARGEAFDLKAVVAREREAYEREQARRQIPRILLSSGEAFYEGMREAGTSDLVGDGVSPGVADGAVRVVLDPRGVRLEPGEILVCPATDPGWTPLFLSAGGLVMEIGGMVTHGSVVAREYGIPAVVGVHEATTRLHTGQRVRVDGSTGRVVVLDGAQETPAAVAQP